MQSGRRSSPLDELKEKNRALQTRATHWEGAARDLLRTVAALQSLYATSSARLDAILADLAHDDLKRDPGPNISAIDGGRQK